MRSIKDNWKAFAEPMKQSVENLSHIKDNISDTIADKMDEKNTSAIKEKDGENSTREKSCSWKVIKWVLLLCVVGVLLSECNNAPIDDNGEKTTVPQPTTQQVGTEDVNNSQLSFIKKQLEYAAKHNIELHRFSVEEASLAKWIDNSNEKTVYLKTDNIFGNDRYKITEKYDGYLYYGELKDGRPDGYGILYVMSEIGDSLLTYENHAFACRYIGQFSDGRFDGFGLLFTESENGHAFLSRLHPYNETTGENVKDFLTWANYAEYFGEFSEGDKSGLGNSFNLSDSYIGTFESALSQIDLDNPSYSIEVGEYKKNQLNGTNRQYIGGYLYYDGESKDDEFDGYGVLYYYGTSMPAYRGEFKNNMRHGKGTSYNEDGEEIYTGEWKNDDYA